MISECTVGNAPRTKNSGLGFTFSLCVCVFFFQMRYWRPVQKKSEVNSFILIFRKTQLKGTCTKHKPAQKHKETYFIQVWTTVRKLHDCKDITKQNGNNEIK